MFMNVRYFHLKLKSLKIIILMIEINVKSYDLRY